MNKSTTALVLILVFGTLLRLTNLNWDSYLAFHPDERNISWAVTRIHFFSQMNPQFFAYGGLPIYLYRALGEIVARITGDTNWIFDWGHIAVIGRYISALLSSMSILLIFLVGKKIFSPAVGLLSAFLLAFSPWAIREAHFATTETMLVFFLLLLLLISNKKPVLSGIILGLATAAKTTSVLFALIPLTRLVLPLTFFSRPLKKSQSIRQTILSIFLLTVIAGIIFFLFSPYTILDWQHFKKSMDYESGVALGRFPVPYTLQFLKTIPYIYQLHTMLWQAGPIAIIGTIGLLLLAFTTIKRKNHTFAIFLIFPLIYFLWQGNWFTKFARYNVPLLPFLTISAAWLMINIFKKISKKRFYWIIGLFAYWIIGLFHLWWGVANWTIYLRPQTRVEASKWMIRNIPSTAIIYTEHWNDGLPVFLPDDPVISFQRELLNVYDPDTENKIATLTNQLEKGDFIILSTRRIWGTIPDMSDRYPYTSQLYKDLLNGTSDYKEVARFTSYPSLFGITINDDPAEESIQVFDHPTVRIFKKNTP